MKNMQRQRWRFGVLLLIMMLLGAAACSAPVASDPQTEPEQTAEDHGEEEHGDEDHEDDDHDEEHGDEDHHDEEHEGEEELLSLPELSAPSLAGEPLRVIATTSIIGDVVAQVGGDVIALTTLMGPGQDPHSYEPAARDLTAVASAHVIFVNGWDLEEGLEDDLETIGGDVPVVPVSAGIDPLPFGEADHDDHGDDDHDDEHGEEDHSDDDHDDDHEEHDHGSADPHVWFSLHNVEQWVENAVQVLSTLDPDNAAVYVANGEAYLAELAALETYAAEQLAGIPEENRYLVTNHGAFGYFARDYDLTVLGTVIPGMSTLSEPSARDLADLIVNMEEYGVCTIFTETTVSDTLAQTAAAELDGCGEVQVRKLYTGAIGPDGSGADSYLGMFQANVDTIAAGLSE